MIFAATAGFTVGAAAAGAFGGGTGAATFEAADTSGGAMVGVTGERVAMGAAGLGGMGATATVPGLERRTGSTIGRIWRARGGRVAPVSDGATGACSGADWMTDWAKAGIAAARATLRTTFRVSKVQATANSIRPTPPENVVKVADLPSGVPGFATLRRKLSRLLARGAKVGSGL